MSDDGRLYVPAGWCAPSGVIYDMGTVFDEEMDKEIQAWPQAIRGGVTYNVTFTNGITSEALRLMWGQPPYEGELETLL